MAPPKAGKIKYNLRMKPAAIAAYKDIAGRTGYPTHAMLCAKILDDCLEYLLDTDRTRMPDALLDLKRKLSARQLNEVASCLNKKEPDAHEALEQFINTIIDRRLAVGGKRKKTG